MGLDDSFEILKELKKSHRRNTALHSQSLALKNYLSNAKSLPQKPTGKKITYHKSAQCISTIMMILIMTFHLHFQVVFAIEVFPISI
jgi:hypothetical protein